MQISDKKSQRSFYSQKRKELDKTLKSRLDKMVFDRFTEAFEDFSDKIILMYVSNDFEVDTIKIIEFLLGKGIKTAVPRCKSDSNVMNFFFIESLSDLEVGHFGISEPKACCKKVENFKRSVCIVPAICFDKKGYRIGYGKGFYDRFFNEYGNGITKIGLSYSDFIIDKISAEDNDISVDMILTECGTYNCTEGVSYER